MAKETVKSVGKWEWVWFLLQTLYSY